MPVRIPQREVRARQHRTVLPQRRYLCAGENFKTRIDVLELEETLAVVRVLEEGWGDKIDFTDVLLLLKIDGEWKCVAKAYNQNSNTIEK